LRLLPILALAQAVGIWTADRGWLDSVSAAVLGALAIAVGIAVGPGANGLRMLSVLLVFLAGSLSLSVPLERAAAPARVPEQPVTIEATVAAAESGHGWVRIDLEQVVGVDSSAHSLPDRVRLIDGDSASGGRRLEAVSRGTRIRARVRLRPLRDVRNPGSRDWTRRSQRRGIGFVGRLVHPSLHVVLSDRSEIAPLAAIDLHRQRISDRLAAAGEGSGLVRALAIGDRTGLSTDARDAFRRLGLSHLLAVSGLHLTLIAALLFTAIRLTVGRCAWLAARRDTRITALAGGVLAAIVYALFAGWGVPVRRALVMLLALGLSVARRRRGLRAEPLSAAAIAVMAFEPAALFDPGPQLSFAAAGGLAYSAPHPDSTGFDQRRSVLRAIEAIARASASAVAVTAPIAARQLGSVAPFGLFANLVAIPWTALVLLPSSLFAAAAAGCRFEPLAGWSAVAAARMAAVTLEWAAWSAANLPSLPATGRPALVWVLASAVCAVPVLRTRKTTARVIGALAVSGTLTLAPTESIHPPPPRLIALEVGQGAASVIQGRRAAVLVDAGASYPGGNWGERAVLPALAALGVQRLDLVVVSHGDLDHRGGVPAILAAVPVGEVWVPLGAAADPTFERIRAAARLRGIAIRERGVGAPAVWLGDLRIAALWPPAETQGRSRNDRSLVLKIEVAGHTLLLPGDLEAAAELDLVRRGADLQAEVLVLPHHGSRSSSSAVFLDAVGPTVAIASAPCDGRFGMPHREVIDRARAAGLSVWWTGRDGAILLGLRDRLTAWGLADSRGWDECGARTADPSGAG
jgi:competence protein ComEC